MGDAFSRCHPVVNFCYFLIVLGCTMFVVHPAWLLVSFAAATAYACRLCGWRAITKRNLLFTFPALIFIAIFNPMFSHYGVTPLVYIESSGNWITLEAMVYGVVLGFVMFVVIQWFSCYNKVMTSDKFVYLFGRVIPALSLILSMVLRFVPHFTAQAGVIRNGQKCAGRDITNAGLIKKVKYGLAILSILVTWALENAIETADSMKSRGYGLKGRTAFSIYRFDKRDKRMACLLAFCFLIFSAGLSKGAAFAQYNPRILLMGFTIFGRQAPRDCPLWICVFSLIAFVVFCFAPLALAVYEDAAMGRSLVHVCSEPETTYRAIYEEIELEGAERQWRSFSTDRSGTETVMAAAYDTLFEMQTTGTMFREQTAGNVGSGISQKGGS